MSKHETQKPKKRWVKILKVSSLTFLVLTISAILFTVSYLLGIEEWQEFDPHQIKEDMELSLLLYDGQGEEYLMLSAGENRLYATIDTIPKHVQNAFVAIEDARFYQHNGIDIVRILGALVEDIKSGSIKQGASTISQQLVKTAALTFLFSEWRVPTAFFLCSAVISPENATQSKLLPSEDNSSFPNSVPP